MFPFCIIEEITFDCLYLESEIAEAKRLEEEENRLAAEKELRLAAEAAEQEVRKRAEDEKARYQAMMEEEANRRIKDEDDRAKAALEEAYRRRMIEQDDINRPKGEDDEDHQRRRDDPKPRSLIMRSVPKCSKLFLVGRTTPTTVIFQYLV